MRSKRVLFSIVAIGIFFGIVEAGLWLASVPTLLSERDPFQGFSSQVRVFARDDRSGLYRTPKRAVAHSFNYQEFHIEKPRNGFRVFTLGDSSAYGFPWGGRVAFTKVLGEALQASWPDRQIEAVNAAAMSYGSYRLRVLSHEVLSYQPDAIVIYNGHNEFVERGFYKALLARSEPLDRARSLLYRWRLYSLLTRLYERSSGGGPATRAEESSRPRTTGELLGLDVVRETSTEVGEAERGEVARLFEENIRAILELARGSGVRVVLCTVPSNLSGWVPNQSIFGSHGTPDDRRAVLQLLAEARAALEAGNPSASLASLEKAKGMAPEYAEVHYRLGQAYEALGRWDEAKASYVRARDDDARPTRAASGFNGAIRRLAAEYGATLVDVERDFEAASPHGIVGFNLLEDYVHPKPEAHRRIAFDLWSAFQTEGLLGERRSADPAVFDAAVSRSPTDAVASGKDSEAPATPALLYNLGVVLENQDRTDEAMEKYAACLERDPGYFMARYNLALLLHKKGRFQEAAAQASKVLEAEPGFVRGMLALGEALRRMGRVPDALAIFERATATDPRSAPAWDGLGGTLSQLGRLPEAEAAFRKAVEADPDRPEFRANLGLTLLFRRDLDGAQATLEAALALHPEHARTRNALAAVLTEKGVYPEAERLFRESLRLDPADGSARAGLELLQRKRGGVR